MGHCYNTTTVSAPVDQVWAALSNFHDWSWAAGVVETCEKVGDVGAHDVGAKRVLNGAIHETLASVDAANHYLTYSIDDGPEPINSSAMTSYIGAVKLYPVTTDGTTFVEWTSKCETTDDGAVAEFCNPIYVALLGALRTHFAS